MDTVYSLDKALEWFLLHPKGQLRCVREDGEEKIVDSYPDAEDFYCANA